MSKFRQEVIEETVRNMQENLWLKIIAEAKASRPRSEHFAIEFTCIPNTFHGDAVYVDGPRAGERVSGEWKPGRPEPRVRAPRTFVEFDAADLERRLVHGWDPAAAPSIDDDKVPEYMVTYRMVPKK